jgi:hypothetical protein
MLITFFHPPHTQVATLPVYFSLPRIQHRPSDRSHKQRLCCDHREGKHSTAQSVTLDIASRKQQYLLANRRYANKATIE